MKEEQLRILKMVEDGRITADDAARLIEALNKSESKTDPREIKRKWLHIKVEKDGEKNVDVKIPLALLKFGFRFAPKHMHMKMANGMSREHRARIREMKQRAREAKAHARAEVRERMRHARKHHKEFADASINMQGIVDEAMGEAMDEALSESLTGMGGILGDDFNLDMERILQMAKDPEFDGKILEVHNDEDDEHVIIELE